MNIRLTPSEKFLKVRIREKIASLEELRFLLFSIKKHVLFLFCPSCKEAYDQI